MTSQLFDETLMKCWQTGSLAQDIHGLRECTVVHSMQLFLYLEELAMVLNQAHSRVELNYTHCPIKPYFLFCWWHWGPKKHALCSLQS